MNYLLTASLVLLAAWPAYLLLLRYSDRYPINRWLMLTGMGSILVLPFLALTSPAPEVTSFVQETVDYAVQQNAAEVLQFDAPFTAEILAEDSSIAGSEATAPAAAATTNFAFTWASGYVIGLALMLLLMGVRLLALLALHLRSRPNGDNSYRLLRPSAKPGQAFTFARTVYFSIDVPDTPDFDHILAHERVHAWQLHSFDILLSEVFLCLFWFHPTAWWLRTKLRANLEYLVDATVAGEGSDRRAYQMALVRQSQINHGMALALPFSEPTLRSRIARMTGLPHHWAVAGLASAGMVIWLGVSGLIVYGNPIDNIPYTDEEPYVAYFADKLPEEIHSFNIYARRVPTVDEYYQIRAILQRVPGVEMFVYKPEFNEEKYMIRLKTEVGHVETTVAVTEAASEVMTYRIGINTAQHPPYSIPPSTRRFITPMAEAQFSGDQQRITNELSNSTPEHYTIVPPGGQPQLPLRSGSWMPTSGDLEKNQLSSKEEFVVRVNGKKVDLSSSILVDAIDSEDQYYQLDNGYVAPAEWTTETLQYPHKTKPQGIDRNKEEILIALGKRVESLMNCEGDCPRSISFSPYNGDSYRTYYEQLDFVDFIEKRSFYNGIPIDLEQLLNTDFGPGSYLTTGWSTESTPNVIVLEVVDENLPEMQPDLSDEVLQEAWNAMYEASQNK